uniref:Uncharacterized protein n=1 Tax=Arundo donax TaxID=35708 RepID=A0A0A9AFR3_ARUDO
MLYTKIISKVVKRKNAFLDYCKQTKQDSRFQGKEYRETTNKRPRRR